ncbi:MAG TPA: SMP-30/gluconolactonase/LRE family protein [Usitatibacter sp.]|jgi:gluconolactonase|nr:SMP-30/gluconolactonase/LRE family protein [Usitatibacter sp.]
MWNLAGIAPAEIEARVLTRLPDAFRRRRRTEWSDANKPGHEVDSFLEGPAFDRDGNLYVVDIPFGRIFRISPALEWTLVAEYDGWPNGLALHRDGSLWIADYRRGLLRMDFSSRAGSGEPVPILAHRNSESFKGLNDLTFDREGNCYFTDQGQTGLHDPTGRVYRLRTNGRLELVIGGIPSPNGLALDRDGKFLFVAVTRANQVWRGPLLPDGSVSKVGAFRTFFGTSGPDGMAIDVDNRLVVAHASLGGAFVVNAIGEVTHFVKSPAGSTVTNVAYRPGTVTLVMTESETGSILEAELPAPGAPLFAHP